MFQVEFLDLCKQDELARQAEWCASLPLFLLILVRRHFLLLQKLPLPTIIEFQSETKIDIEIRRLFHLHGTL
jgi:hypothetical protein